MTRKPTQADKAAAKRLLADKTIAAADPEPRLNQMIRDLIAEGAKHGIKVSVDMVKPGDDPWVYPEDLQVMQQLQSMKAQLEAQGITPTAAILHPSYAPRKVEGVFIDANGEKVEFEGKVLPKAVKVGNQVMTRQHGTWHPKP